MNTLWFWLYYCIIKVHIYIYIWITGGWQTMIFFSVRKALYTYALLYWHTHYIILTPLLWISPKAFSLSFSPPSRVRKGFSRFCTGTWRYMAQFIMRHRDLRRSQPLWRTTVCWRSMSCNNCCERLRQDTEDNTMYSLPFSASVPHNLHM